MGQETQFYVDYPNEHFEGVKQGRAARLLKRLKSPTVISIVLSVIFSGVPWWIQPLMESLESALVEAGISESLANTCSDVLGAFLIAVALVLLVVFIVFVHRGLDEDALMAQRHQIAQSRFASLLWRVRKDLEVDERLDSIAYSPEELKDLLSTIASEAEGIFSALVESGRIGIAIRVLTQDEAGKDLFPTFARAGNLSAKRDLTSVPLDGESGVIRIASEGGESCDAVFIFNDAKKAFESGLLSPDFNSTHEPYASEVLSLAFTRINESVYQDDERVHDKLIGIFYVTANQKNAFDSIITNYMVMVAEVLSLLLDRVSEYGMEA